MPARRPGQTGRAWLIWLQAAVIVAATLWAYAPVRSAGWVWDDVEEVTQNAVLRDPAGLAKIWFAPDSTDYFPLKTTVEWLEFRAWGDAPVGYHAVNVALHLLSALLCWRLFSRLGAGPGWIGGLLFAVHPLAVESVAWISELKNTLSLPLLLGALLAYLAFDETGSRRAYAWSLAAFLLALLAKTSVAMAPAVLLLHAWWRRGRITRRDLAVASPFLGLSLVLGAVTVWFQDHRAIMAGHEFAGGPATRFLGAGRAIAFYLGRSLWPAGLAPIYPRWNLAAAPLAGLWPWLALAIVVAIGWRRRATWGRHLLLGLGFFVFALLPILGFVGMSYLRMARVADHFAYVSLVGVIGLVVAGFSALPRAAWVALAGAAAVLALQTRAYVGVFHDEETLWTYTLAHNPEAWAAHNNLGYALFQDGRVPEAIFHYREALRLEPEFAEARYNLGTALLREGQVGAAIVEYEEALRLKPASAEVENNLASALAQTGRLPEALAHFQHAVRVEPDYADGHHNLGNALLLSGRPAEAIVEYQRALRLRPDDQAAKSGIEMAARALQSRRP